MAPTVKEPEQQNAVPAASTSAAQPRVQPVALEISVTVNGVRTIEGSDKREPFSETTQTVLVYGTGAVIRLSSGVAPGQLLFLTNEKTKKEVVCQVVKSKNYRSASGYVELEFTEPAVGFWGMRFPTDRVAPVATPTGTATAIPAKPANVAPIEKKPVKPILQEKPAVIAPPFPAAPPASVAAPPAPVAAMPVSATPVNVTPVDSEPMAPVAPPVVDSATEELKRQTARLQEQLSTLNFEETPTAPPKAEQPIMQFDAIAMSDATATIFEMAEPEKEGRVSAPAVPVTPKREKPANFSQDEEVKIPAWLEPLARNAATPSSPAPVPVAVTSTPVVAPPVVSSTPAPPPVANVVSFPLTIAAIEAPQSEDAQVAGESYDFGNKTEEVTPMRSEFRAPSFESNLFGSGEAIDSKPASGGSKKGLWIGAVAATVLLAAGGGWWYMQQNGHAAASSTAAVSRPENSQSVPETQPQQTFQTNSLPQSDKPFSNPTPANAQPVNNPAQTVAPATQVQKIGNGKDGLKPTPASAAGRAAEPIVQPKEESKKTDFKGLHLAAPTVKGGKTANASNEAEPGIAMENANGPSTGTVNLGLGGNSGPKAPITVGGEVSSAQLVSSVPPVYPSIARTQRISGDVKIDASIDENGRVTGMKVVSGPVLLHQAAMDALRQWRYKPAMLNGSAVSMHLLVTIQFRLQ